MSGRDAKRLDAIRALPCCNCGKAPRSQAAHSNFAIHGKGRGIKAGDLWTIPLCAECHYRLDNFALDMSRDESLEWFVSKVNQTNEVLERGENDKSVF